MKVFIRYLISSTATVIAISLSGCASHHSKYNACAKSNQCEYADIAVEAWRADA